LEIHPHSIEPPLGVKRESFQKALKTQAHRIENALKVQWNSHANDFQNPVNNR